MQSMLSYLEWIQLQLLLFDGKIGCYISKNISIINVRLHYLLERSKIIKTDLNCSFPDSQKYLFFYLLTQK